MRVHRIAGEFPLIGAMKASMCPCWRTASSFCGMRAVIEGDGNVEIVQTAAHRSNKHLVRACLCMGTCTTLRS